MYVWIHEVLLHRTTDLKSHSHVVILGSTFRATFRCYTQRLILFPKLFYSPEK